MDIGLISQYATVGLVLIILQGLLSMSGSGPTLLHFGLSTFSATWFAPSALLIAMVVSTFTGS
jgi:hypothetical protein